MIARHRTLSLTPEFLERARELSASNRSVARLLPKTLDKLVARPDDPSLHREPLHVAGRLSSSRVNRKYRVIDRDETPGSMIALFVGNHEDAYQFADHYTNLRHEEIGDVWGEIEQAETVAASASQPLVLRLPRADTDEESARFVSVERLMELGLSRDDAESVRSSAWSGISFAGFFGADLGDRIETLLVTCAPPSPRPELVPIPLPRATASACITLTEPGQFAAMLEIGLDRYLTTLTEDQRALAGAVQQGLLVVKGAGGSGKTTIAAYRVKTLADRIQRQPALFGGGPRRVLYLCYNHALADMVERMLATLYASDPVPAFVQARTLYSWALDYVAERSHGRRGADQNIFAREIGQAYIAHRDRFIASPALRAGGSAYVLDEIRQVIIGRGLDTRVAYLDADRAGRGQPLNRTEREVIWEIFDQARLACERRNILPVELVLQRALGLLEHDARFVPYEAVVVDEAQDLTPVALRLTQRLVRGDLARLTVFADMAQAIYRHGFRWKLAELTPRGGQVRTLSQNHRNTREVQRLALNLLENGDAPDEADTYVEQQVSERLGPTPELLVYTSVAREISGICARIADQITSASVLAQNIAVVAGKRSILDQIEEELKEWDIPCDNISGSKARPQRHGYPRGISAFHPGVKLLTMHAIKGLDFPHVYIVNLTARGLPLDPIDDAEAHANQRRLLYTAMIRAGQTLTLSTVSGQIHPLLRSLDTALYTCRDIPEA